MISYRQSDMCGEKNSEKISEFEVGVEPTTFQTRVGCSANWATKNSSDEQVICGLT